MDPSGQAGARQVEIALPTGIRGRRPQAERRNRGRHRAGRWGDILAGEEGPGVVRGRWGESLAGEQAPALVRHGLRIVIGRCIFDDYLSDLNFDV